MNYSFLLSNGYIEKLVALFRENGYKFACSSKGIHSFDWPHIILSDKNQSQPNCISTETKSNNSNLTSIIDPLGVYQAYSIIPSNGIIILYYEKIRIKSKDFFYSNDFYFAEENSVNYTELDCFNALINIVLIHEFVHWIIHTKVGFNPIKYTDDDEKFFHESFAQYFTWQLIKECPLSTKIFKDTCQTAPDAYINFKELKYAGEDGLISETAAIRLLKILQEADNADDANHEAYKEFKCLQSFQRVIELIKLHHESSEEEKEKYLEKNAAWFFYRNYPNTLDWLNDIGITKETIDNLTYKKRGTIKGREFGF